MGLEYNPYELFFERTILLCVRRGYGMGIAEDVYNLCL